MSAPAADPAVVAFYSGHPISAAIVLDKLRRARGHVERLRPEDLFAHDQDHYGGLEANDALARLAGLAPGLKLADFGAGLGGPARYFAHRYGVEVTGIELTPARVEGANRLTALVGLSDRVRVLEGDVRATALPSGAFDAVISQEALLHVPERARALAEAFRVLRPGGRLAFTDWIAHRPPSQAEFDLLRQGMAVQPIETMDSYRVALEGAGFAPVAAEDLTRQWAPILAQRLKMYEALRTEALKAGTPAGHDAFYRSYVLLVRLVTEGALGGIRIGAARTA